MKKLLLLCSLLVLTISGTSQVRRDPRTMTGLDKASLPPVVKMSDVMKHAVPGGVLRGAQFVGTARIEKMEVTPGEKLSLSADNKPGTTFWKVLRAQNGTVNWMWRMGNAPEGQDPQSVGDPIQVLEGVKDILHISDPKNEFVTSGDTRD